MQRAIDETNRRRGIQMAYNEEHGITPTTVKKSKEAIMSQTSVADSKKGKKSYYVESEDHSIAADPVVAYMDKNALEKMVQKTQKSMEKAARELDFIEAAKLRDCLLYTSHNMGHIDLLKQATGTKYWKKLMDLDLLNNSL